MPGKGQSGLVLFGLDGSLGEGGGGRANSPRSDISLLFGTAGTAKLLRPLVFLTSHLTLSPAPHAMVLIAHLDETPYSPQERRARK